MRVPREPLQLPLFPRLEDRFRHGPRVPDLQPLVRAPAGEGGGVGGTELEGADASAVPGELEGGGGGGGGAEVVDVEGAGDAGGGEDVGGGEGEVVDGAGVGGEGSGDGVRRGVEEVDLAFDVGEDEVVALGRIKISPETVGIAS